MKITPAASTVFLLDEWNGWVSEEHWEFDGMEAEGSNLAEFAGRSCYRSWKKPNPATATNAGYLGNIIEQGHFSVMEHGSMSFYVEDCSRSFTHELIRHRHHSYPQLSRRFVKIKKGADPVIPPLFMDDRETAEMLLDAWESAFALYERLVAQWEPRLLEQGVDPHMARKRTREAARAVLPNMTPTAIRRGQEAGLIRSDLPAEWVVTAMASMLVAGVRASAGRGFGDSRISASSPGPLARPASATPGGCPASRRRPCLLIRTPGGPVSAGLRAGGSRTSAPKRGGRRRR